MKTIKQYNQCMEDLLTFDDTLLNRHIDFLKSTDQNSINYTWYDNDHNPDEPSKYVAFHISSIHSIGEDLCDEIVMIFDNDNLFNIDYYNNICKTNSYAVQILQTILDDPDLQIDNAITKSYFDKVWIALDKFGADNREFRNMMHGYNTHEGYKEYMRKPYSSRNQLIGVLIDLIRYTDRIKDAIAAYHHYFFSTIKTRIKTEINNGDTGKAKQLFETFDEWRKRYIDKLNISDMTMAWLRGYVTCECGCDDKHDSTNIDEEDYPDDGYYPYDYEGPDKPYEDVAFSSIHSIGGDKCNEKAVYLLKTFDEWCKRYTDKLNVSDLTSSWLRGYVTCECGNVIHENNSEGIDEDYSYDVYYPDDGYHDEPCEDSVDEYENMEYTCVDPNNNKIEYVYNIRPGSYPSLQKQDSNISIPINVDMPIPIESANAAWVYNFDKNWYECGNPECGYNIADDYPGHYSNTIFKKYSKCPNCNAIKRTAFVTKHKIFYTSTDDME